MSSDLTATQMFFEIQQYVLNHTTPIMLVTTSEKSAKQLYHEILRQLPKLTAIYFPAWDTLPYDRLTPSPVVIGQRLKALYQTLTQPIHCVITTYEALIERCPPADFIMQNTLILKTHDLIPLTTFSRQLGALGYQSTDIVTQPGEFAQRGALIDVYPLGASTAYRIDWFDDEIDSIRRFNTETQLSTQKIDQIHHFPTHEYLLNSLTIQNAIQAIGPIRQSRQNHFIKQLQSEQHDQLHYFLDLFHSKMDYLTDYLPDDMMLLHQAAHPESIIQSIDERNQMAYQAQQHTQYLLAPERIWAPHLIQQLKTIYAPKLRCRPLSFELHTAPAQSNFTQIKEALNLKRRCVLTAHHHIGLEPLSNQMKSSNITYQIVQTFQDIKNPGVYLAESALLDTIDCPDLNLSLIPESCLNTRPAHSTRSHIPKTHADFQSEHTIFDFNSIKKGDHIVHEQYGIGRFLGIQSLSIRSQQSDFLTLEYADSDQIHLPIQDLPQLSRYIGSTQTLKLSSLNSKQWQKTKQRAQKQIESLTGPLLEMYAKRNASKGIELHVDEILLNRFNEQLPFQLTQDQVKTIQDIQSDLSSSFNMDRLVCADVGFRKTEVAMQAAFICGLSGYQILLLAPTTVLAAQHYHTLKSRFEGWPFNIQQLSRHTSLKQQSTLASELERGTIDIFITTHAGLNPKYHFKKLGLLIVDEEHKFGVKHKELLQRYRAYTNILSLTATPIPRTLNLALSQYRSLSVMSTPPQARLAVKTIVCDNTDPCIHNAILREVHRGGQIYYCVNDIDRLPQIKQQLQKRYPEIQIDIAHGQIPAQHIQSVMHSFYTEQTQLLLCTTLIESGLDVPNANTLIIERADLMGMAQLHQLRGRVGRSNIQAFAYLGTPKDYTLSKAAHIRLDTLVTHQSLGSGFRVSIEDLELRGAGELFGAKQSGAIQQVGLATYIKLLNQNLAEHQTDPVAAQIPIHSDCACHIPLEYIQDENLRMEVYCRLTTAPDLKALEDIKSDLSDRFGPIPESLNHLIDLIEFKYYSRSTYIQSIHLSEQSYAITLQAQGHLLARLNRMLKHLEQLIEMKPPRTLCIQRKDPIASRAACIEVLKKIETISLHPTPSTQDSAKEIF